MEKLEREGGREEGDGEGVDGDNLQGTGQFEGRGGVLRGESVAGRRKFEG